MHGVFGIVATAGFGHARRSGVYSPIVRVTDASSCAVAPPAQPYSTDWLCADTWSDALHLAFTVRLVDVIEQPLFTKRVST